MAKPPLWVELMRDIGRYYYREMFDEVLDELKRNILVVDEGVMIGKTKVQYSVESFDGFDGRKNDGDKSPSFLVSVVDGVEYYGVTAWGARLIERDNVFVGEPLMIELYDGI